MSKVAIQGNASGTGVFTIASPNSNTDRTLTLPDSTGALLNDASSLAAANLTGDVAAARITDSLNATGSAPLYACRAWVNFNGQGTVAIRASGNVSSITDRSTGRYTINFTTPMPDNNYCACGTTQDQGGGYFTFHETGTYAVVFSTTSLQVESYGTSNNDSQTVCYSIFR